MASSPMTYREDILAVVRELLAGRPEVRERRMFGLPGFMVAGKMFASVYGDGLTLKLPKDTVQEVLSRPDARPFAPMPGRTMREWVLIVHDDPAAFAEDVALLEAAIEFVANGPVADSASRPTGRRAGR